MLLKGEDLFTQMVLRERLGNEDPYLVPRGPYRAPCRIKSRCNPRHVYSEVSPTEVNGAQS